MSFVAPSLPSILLPSLCRRERQGFKTDLISPWFSSPPAHTFLVVLASPSATATSASSSANEFPLEASSVQRACRKSHRLHEEPYEVLVARRSHRISSNSSAAFSELVVN